MGRGAMFLASHHPKIFFSSVLETWSTTKSVFFLPSMEPENRLTNIGMGASSGPSMLAGTELPCRAVLMLTPTKLWWIEAIWSMMEDSMSTHSTQTPFNGSIRANVTLLVSDCNSIWGRREKVAVFGLSSSQDFFFSCAGNLGDDEVCFFLSL